MQSYVVIQRTPTTTKQSTNNKQILKNIYINPNDKYMHKQDMNEVTNICLDLLIPFSADRMVLLSISFSCPLSIIKNTNYKYVVFLVTEAPRPIIYKAYHS